MRQLCLLATMGVLLPLAVRYPIIGILLWDWISYMDPHRVAYGFVSGIPWAQLTVAATVIGCFVAKEPKRFPVNATTVLTILFLIGVTITTLTALAPTDLVLPAYTKVAKMFVILPLSAALLTSRRRIHAVLWVMAISLGYFAVDQGGASLATAGGHHVVGPPDSLLTDNNEFAAGLLTVLPLMNYLRLQSPDKWVRRALLTVIVLGLIAVLGTYSRGAMLALAALCAVFWTRSRRKIPTGIVMVIVLGLAIWFMPDTWTDRMHSISHYKADQTADQRLAIWGVAWRIALAHPYLGGGFNVTIYDPLMRIIAPHIQPFLIHSIWFQVLGEQGFVIFSIWLGLTLVGIRNSFRLIKETRGIPGLEWCNDLARMVQCSIVAYCVAGSFLPIGYWDLYFNILVCLAAAREVAAMEIRKALPASTPKGLAPIRDVTPARASGRPAPGAAT